MHKVNNARRVRIAASVTFRMAGTSYSGAAVGGTLKAAVRIGLFLNGLLLANMVFSYTLTIA